MRILVDDPSRISPARYRRFLRRVQVEGMVADHLADGDLYLALNAVVLSPEERATLQRLSETFATAFMTAARQVASNVPLLVEWGFPWAAAELLAVEPPRQPLLGRFDFVQDVDGRWWLLEFNADTPSGVREAVVADRVAHAALPEAAGLTRLNQGLEARVTAAFGAALTGLPPGSALGLVTAAEALEDLMQMAFLQRLLAAPLAARDLAVVLGDYHNLVATGRGIAVCGRPVAALYRYVPFESVFGTPFFAALYQAVVERRLLLLNGLYGLLLQHKGLLAWLWEHRDDPCLTPAERAAVRDHLPPTWWVRDAPEGVARADLVAKQVFGREGEEVFFGVDLAPEEWALLRRRRTYVVQQRVSVAEVTAAVQTPDGACRQRGGVTVGSFVVDGAWAGCYSRFGSRLITAQARWLATYVEPTGGW
ncbi:MAG TPA: glutathionylspermidine synthase family protein [Chloroflexota bacterium]